VDKPLKCSRFRADVIDLKPTIVVLLAGGNDIAGNTGPSTLEMIQNNIFSMVELAKSHHIKLFYVPFYLLIIFIGVLNKTSRRYYLFKY
jgi:lysophospholipase L1-like esterase